MAAITPQIIAAHGLSQDEYARIRKVLGRDPNLVELGIFSAMWSEHCSYKSSRRFLKQLPIKGSRVLQGPGENAGVVDVGGGLAVAFKMESHNHPSYIEPYQGAATGVGGILRDVFTMGARPIASMNALRFGDPSHPKTAALLEGVVAGIAGYGNCIGVPTVAGEVAFDASYNGNCLVNAFTLGLLKASRIFRGTASGVGNPVIYIGARTGRDGIHGATMASAEFDEESESKRPTVQVGDPFMEKLLLEACLELFKTDCLVGIQDMGAAGLTSSSVEMASRAGSGLELDVDAVPRRETGMTPYEVMLSESQERMLLVAKKGREKEVFEICDKWDLAHALVGRVTDTGKLVVKSGGDTVAQLPIAPLTDEAPVYDRPRRRPSWQDEVQKMPDVPLPENLVAALKTVLASPSVASKEWVYRQYDHMVRIGTAIRPGQGDAAVVRFTGQRDGGVALSVGCNSRWCYLEPRLGAAHAVAETARNVSCVGGEPLAITDCLNFGNPERPEIMWQFEQACLGIADACTALETPVVSGNVSLYNETEGKAVFPTPMIGMVALMDDCAKNAGSSFAASGDRIAIVGGLGNGHLGGSEYLQAVHGAVAGLPPPLDFARERAVQKAVRDAVRAGLLKAAHDVSDGGLAVTLAEMCFGKDVGCRVSLKSHLRPDALLFGEGASRIVVSYTPANREKVEAICRTAGAPFEDIGQVGGSSLIVEGVLEAKVAHLKEPWSTAIPRLVGEGIHHAALEGVP
jgi:phosphoribosylformylglycinamidine synthase II